MAANVRSYYNYDPATGKLYPATPRQGAKAGVAVGSEHRNGYLETSYKRKRMLVHRLVWAWHHGRWPTALLDHINNDKTDNRIENLREADEVDNGANAKRSKANTTGVKGLSTAPNGRWRGTVQRNGKQYTYQATDRTAVEHWLIETRRKLAGEFTNHGK